MKIEETKHINSRHYRCVLPFGSFYFFDKFFLSEINEGEHFDWDKIMLLMVEVYKYYGENFKLAYMSNRVNSYSIEPQSWVKFQKKYNCVLATAIVAYNNKGSLSVVLERLFFKEKLQKFSDLDEAISWVQNLEELKKIY